MQSFAKSKLSILSRHSNKILLFTATYVLGIILGIFFIGNTESSSILYSNASSYHVIIFDTSISYFSIFFKCFFAGALLCMLTVILGLSVYTIPFICIVLFYRGVILGTALIIFYSISGISGIVIFIILTLPMHVVITLGLIASSVLNYDIDFTCKLKVRLIRCIKNAIVGILFTLVASIYLLFIMITVIRPINLIFWIKFK